MAHVGLEDLAPQFVEIDGLRIRYLSSEEGSGPPILLISPWPQSILAFQAIWPRLVDAGPVVAVDLPGFGGSEGRSDVFTPPGMGAFVAAAVQHFSLERPHAVGPDIGTTALLYAAAADAELFSSLVVGSGAIDERLTAGALKDIIEAPSTKPWEESDGADVASQVISSLMQARPSDDQMEDYRNSYAGDRFVESMAYVRAYPRSLPPLRQMLPEIATPVQIIYGLEDPVVLPSNAELLDAQLPHSVSLGLDCGHFTWEDGADPYGEAVRTWVDGGFREV